jgi:hypothetical protein
MTAAQLDAPVISASRLGVGRSAVASRRCEGFGRDLDIIPRLPRKGAHVSDSDVMARIADIEAQVQELKAVQDLLLRVLATTKPLSSLIEYYGATESRERALYRLLDDLVERIHGPKHRQPAFGDFKVRLGELFPDLRGDRQFVQLLIDTLKVERPAYQELHRYMVDHRWPVWD